MVQAAQFHFWAFGILLGFCAVLLSPVAGHAQSSEIYVLSQDRLYNESAFGVRVRSKIETRTQAIIKENQRLAEELEVGEKNLTEKRPTLEPAEFRALADAFDVKVEEIRTAQAKKNQELGQWSDNEQKRFFEAAIPLIVKLATEAGALVVLESRTVIISADSIDLTNRAIELVNAEIGDGTQPNEE